MGDIETYASTNMIFVTHFEKHFFECGIHHTSKWR